MTFDDVKFVVDMETVINYFKTDFQLVGQEGKEYMQMFTAENWENRKQALISDAESRFASIKASMVSKRKSQDIEDSSYADSILVEEVIVADADTALADSLAVVFGME